jgi:hypothetical protein
MLLRAVIAGLDVPVDGFAGGIPDRPPRHVKSRAFSAFVENQLRQTNLAE